MPLSGDERVCPQFQPNIFDASRCHECLRLKHLHTHTPTHTPEQVNPVTESSIKEEKEQSKEDSDDVSVVSGGSVCILSPECDLYVCDGDESEEDERTFNSQCESDSSSTCSFTPEEEEDVDTFHHPRMTRLDPPSHRNNPHMWMEETRTRDTFARRSSVPHGGSKGDRESGYYSLGRVAGVRTLNDQIPAPRRHAERGHPLPSNQIPEPKAAIPFRNPDLGVPSQRRTSESPNADLALVPLIDSSDFVDLSIEVEAQAGPRSLSPTPFKQAESLAASKKKGFRAQNSSSFSSSKKDTSYSRSSPPSRSSSPFKRTESISSLSSRGYGKDSVSERQAHQSKSPNRNSFGRPAESETIQKKFKTIASAVGATSNITKSQSRPYADLRASLKKTEPTSGKSLRNLSPPRRSHDATGQSLLQKTETKNFTSCQKKSESRNPSPSRSSSQSVFRKAVEGWRSASPVRKGYGTASQPGKTLVSNGRSHSSTHSSPSRRDFEASSLSLHKSESKRHTSPIRRSSAVPTKQSLTQKSVSDRSLYSRSSSPSKQVYDPPGQSRFHKSDSSDYSRSNRSLSNRSPSPSKQGYDPPGQSSFHKSYSNDYSRSNRSPGNRSPSPSKKSYDSPGQSVFRSEHSNCSKSHRGQSMVHKTVSESRIESSSYIGKSSNSSKAGSCRGSTHSLHSPSTSRNSSPSRKGNDIKVVGIQKSANVSWSTSERRQGRDKHSSSCRNRSPSPLMRSHTSSQSSIDSVISSGSSGLNREEYAVMADLPRAKRVLQRAKPNHMEEMERGSRDETSLYKPASHSHTKPAHITWDDMTDQHGNPSHTYTPSQTNKMEQERSRKVQQPDLLNFKKGWMSKLDENGEWKKHWFVLTDAGLKYYRDSGAEEKDELDGEIDLRSCLKVLEFDVEKNYGFQIQTIGGVFTLSAMTAGIRRNWIEVLRKNIRPSSTPDITQLPDSTTEKEESCNQPPRRQAESSSTPSHTRHKLDYVELSPVATPTSSAPTTQREAGEGQVREHGQGQEDKSRSMQRELFTSRKWPGKTSEQKRLEEEIERKWEEFERLPLKSTVSLSALGSLQREVTSLKQQAECVQGVCVQGCVCEGRVCVCCSVGLEQMERAHRYALEELERKHQRQIAEMEREKERLLNEETQATARVMEALKKAHKEDLERDVHKSKQLATQTAGARTLQDQRQQELLSLRRELDGLSDRYSQKCLELNREQQNNGEKERQISKKEREMEELRRQNQDLQSRLSEEIRRICSFVKGQRSEEVILDINRRRSVCELEVLLKVKHCEVEYMHKEISGLRNEVQFLNTEKQSVCAHYQDMCEELKVLKERSEREVQTLREHLRLAVAALQEARGLHNSI